MTGYHASDAMHNAALITTELLYLSGNSFYRVATHKSAVGDVLESCLRRPVFSQSFGVEVGLKWGRS